MVRNRVRKLVGDVDRWIIVVAPQVQPGVRPVASSAQRRLNRQTIKVAIAEPARYPIALPRPAPSRSSPISTEPMCAQKITCAVADAPMTPRPWLPVGQPR